CSDLDEGAALRNATSVAEVGGGRDRIVGQGSQAAFLVLACRSVNPSGPALASHRRVSPGRSPRGWALALTSYQPSRRRALVPTLRSRTIASPAARGFSLGLSRTALVSHPAAFR